MSGRFECQQVELEGLLLDSESAASDSARAHLEACGACQRRLEMLAASQSWWCELRDHLHDSVAGLTGAEGSESFWMLPNLPDMTGILGPPSHPEMLGRISRYEVEKLLGRGGMGIVFKAFDSELNRPVAIKVLAPHLSGQGTARQRFGREARAAAAVMHEHVVSIHDVQTTGPVPFLVMQYVPGESLQTRLEQQGPLGIRDLVRVGQQIAAGLAAAHAQGVVHRDIKPGNIMLENGLGRVVITDFGLALAADECSLTHTGTLAGTPHYMSPEQVDAQPLDHRTDLFSLGSVLYVMATGRAPFRGERPMAVLHSICHDQPPSIRTLNAAVPEALAALIEALHAKNPERRIQSAAEVRDLLTEYLAHLQQPLSVPLPKMFGRLQRRAGRFRRRRLVGGLATAFVVAGAVAFSAWRIDRQSRAQPNTGQGAVFPRLTNTAHPAVPRLSDVDRRLDEAAREIAELERTTTSLEALIVPQPDAWMDDVAGVDLDLRRLEATPF